MRIATWNVNSLRVRLPQVLEWIGSARPDLLALQETKTTDDEFPREAIEAAGYGVIYSGQKTYNGVAVISRLSATPMDITTDLPSFDDHQRRVLGATYGELRLLNLYVPNGSEVGSDKYAYKLNWLEVLHDYLRTQVQSHRYVVVVGDFNIAPEDRDVHDPEMWEGSVLVSAPERDAFHKLIGLGLVDTFRLFQQEAGSFTWWDYRAAAFRRNLGLRIDHILASAALGQLCVACSVDKEPRRWERPSDHAPVVADFQLEA